jgi:hypothetical protein
MGKVTKGMHAPEHRPAELLAQCSVRSLALPTSTGLGHEATSACQLSRGPCRHSHKPRYRKDDLYRSVWTRTTAFTFIAMTLMPAFFSPEDAMRPIAPVIPSRSSRDRTRAATRSHGDLGMYPPIPNVIVQFNVRHGDVARAFATPHKIFEQHFRRSFGASRLYRAAYMPRLDQRGRLRQFISRQ